MAESLNSQKKAEKNVLREEHEVIVNSVIYHNDTDGYTVARVETLGGGENLIVVGMFHAIKAGMPLIIRGAWKEHPKYGRRFQVESYETAAPRTETGILRFLEGFIKGVGPVMAKRLVKQFGEKTIEVLENHPERLLEVEGIGKRKAEEIRQAWDEKRSVKNVMMFLQSHNISPAYSVKIFKQYGNGAVDVLRENPYKVARDITGIGFRIADRIAMNLGVSPDSRGRIQAGIEYSLEQAANDGHVFLPEEILISKAAEYLGVGEPRIEEELENLVAEQERLVRDGGKIYLLPYHYCEAESAKRLGSILKARTGEMSFPLLSEKEEVALQRSIRLQLDAEQLEVLQALSEEKIVILTGGPGTGKTVAIKAVIQVFRNAGKSIALAAPTGRASKRMTEATGSPAKTIHRLLEYTPKARTFLRNEHNPLECDLIIIDEMSMVDLWLFYHFLKAVKNRTRLLLVGDADQLPSVGAGNVLRNLIQSDIIKTITLKTIHRQAQTSDIVLNAHRVNTGEMPSLKNRASSDFFFIERENPDDILNTVVSLCTEKIKQKFHFHTSDIQVITPMYRGAVGVDNLNKTLQEKLNPAKDIQCGTAVFRIDDRVMQIRNDYEKEVFNGDVGYIKNISTREGKLEVSFPEHSVVYDFSEADQLVLAYAVTVHKSQGSEYPVVVFPITTYHYPMLQRNLLYTAITRAKEMVVMVGTKRAVAIAAKNNRVEERYSALHERLIRAVGS
ncbi:MAG: ATP-dependent RecD-like DNA helicase [bacterium]